MATVVQPEVLLTVEEFARRPGAERRLEELVQGRVVVLSPPGLRHGITCNRVGRILGDFVERAGLGFVVNNDSGVITSRNPDTLRGADIAYYSFERIPRDRITSGYPDSPPNLVFEVRSPSDRWAELLRKVGEYLGAGVSTVIVLDDETRTAQVYDPDRPVRVLAAEDELTLPTILPGFQVGIRQFFE